MEAFYNGIDMKLVFTSNYNPHEFIEHVFERIKRRFRKLTKVNDK